MQPEIAFRLTLPTPHSTGTGLGPAQLRTRTGITYQSVPRISNIGCDIFSYNSSLAQ